jgi:hypothetical protein
MKVVSCRFSVVSKNTTTEVELTTEDGELTTENYEPVPLKTTPTVRARILRSIIRFQFST